MTRHEDHLYQDLLEKITSLCIIDTHEHVPVFKSPDASSRDFLSIYLASYARSDLRSAGMPAADLEKAMNSSLPLMDRWLLCEPYWKACKNTGYIQAHEWAARALYGIPQISRETINDLNSRFLAERSPDRYAHVLQQLNILCAVVDSDLECDRRYARPAFRMEEFVEKIRVENVRLALGVPICSFIEWLEACDETIDKAIHRGAVAFKSTIATDRTLEIGWGTYSEAEQSFIDALREDNGSRQPSKGYQDFMFRHILNRITRLGLPVQLHTGMAASNANIISNGNPALLCPLFCEYRDTDFILMHMGFPYSNELSAIGKMFPNVYLDMCWAHILSPQAARNALSNWLDAMPVSKIMAFGGDAGHEDHICAYLQFARENVCRVLVEKVVQGAFSVDHAAWMAHMMFLDNPYRVFKLKKAGINLPQCV